MKCSLEVHTCKFGAERKWRGYPQFNEHRFNNHFKGNCDGRAHYSIRVHHSNSERWGMGHHCQIVDKASKACLCRCHDQYRSSDANSAAPLLQPAAVAPEPDALNSVPTSRERNIFDSMKQHAELQPAPVLSSAP